MRRKPRTDIAVGNATLRHAERAVIRAARNRAILKPKTALAPKSFYTAVAVGKTGGVEDLAGNPLAASRIWRFTTR